jgi:hypothetical protein
VKRKSICGSWYFRKRTVLIGYLIPAFLLLQMIYPASLLIAADDQLSCEKNLTQAEESYYNGEFDKTIAYVRECLNDPELSEELTIRAYTILARTYLAKNDSTMAKENVNKILEADPTYQPTIEQETPRYVNLVDDVRTERAALQTDSAISSWVWIGAGSAAAVAIIAIIASSGDDHGTTAAQPLPKPPDFPK